MSIAIVPGSGGLIGEKFIKFFSKKLYDKRLSLNLRYD